MNASKVIARNSLVYWRGWRWSVFLNVLSPVMFLSAMGLGLGTLVDRGGSAFGHSGYLAFFATGMLAAMCMQSGAFSATYPVMNHIRWQKNYEALVATPLNVADVFLGELAWIGVMLTVQSVAFVVVMAVFGVELRWTSILVVPAAVLVGLSFAAPIMALTATLETDEPFIWLFRFVITPLFLLSGTFFPLTGLPHLFSVIANLSPLYHGIALVRGLTISRLDFASATVHVVFLAAVVSAASAVGIKTFTRRLIV
jgi:lipooligosaccharide transport system permease protein